METAVKPLLVLGLGNDILTDDAVGLQVANAVAARVGNHSAVEVICCCEMGLALLDYIVDRRALVVVDSVQTGKVPPGHVHVVGEADLPALPGMSPHFLGVGEILVLGRKLGHGMPERVQIFAIEVDDPFTLGERLSPALAATFPAAVAQVEALVRQWAGEVECG